MIVLRWVQQFTPLLVDAARPCRHVPGDRWFVDDTYLKVAGGWIFLYRAIDQFGQVIDVLVAENRDLAATRRFFIQALDHSPRPAAVSTDRAPAYSRVLDELLPSAGHVTELYATDEIVNPSDSARSGFVLDSFLSPSGSRFKTSVRSRGQGGAPSWTNDLDPGEDRRSVGQRWAWFDPVAKSRVGRLGLSRRVAL